MKNKFWEFKTEFEKLLKKYGYFIYMNDCSVDIKKGSVIIYPTPTQPKSFKVGDEIITQSLSGKPIPYNQVITKIIKSINNKGIKFK